MSDLLIHSMSEFAHLILPALECAGAAHIAEIGAEFGGMSQHLADHCQHRGGHLTSIDPAPQPVFLEWAAACAHVTHIAQPSLDAIPHLANIDAWVIDGDHNYYTVSRELALADGLCRRDGRPLLAFLHDVGWPSGRRDMYYAPDRIPAQHRHTNSYEAGVTLGNPAFLVNRGFRGHGHSAWALHSGGPANGVLTAVEDFIASAATPRRPLAYIHIPAVFGLGVVFDGGAPWADGLRGLLGPSHDNPLLAALEVNRLRNYLAVIEWQDRQAEGTAI